MNEVPETIPENVVEVFPLSKGKRSLAFLADFFLIFIASLFYFYLACMPLGKLAANFNGRQEESSLAMARRDSVLYGHNVLLAAQETDKTNANFGKNLEFTFTAFVYEFVKDIAPVPAYDAFKGNVFENYFVTAKGSPLGYASFFTAWNRQGFFESQGGSFVLAPVFHEEFSHAFLPGDALSTLAYEHWQMLQEKFFLPAYEGMLSDIERNDLIYNGISYNQQQAIVTAFIGLEETLTVSCAFIAYFLGAATITLLIPMVSKNRKTAAMLFMRNERIDQEKLVLLKRPRAALLFIYHFVSSLGLLFLLPLGAYDIVSLMSLPILFPVSMVSLLFVLGSLISMLVDYYNRTLTDRLTRSVMVSQLTLDEIYRAKGYIF